MVPDGGKTIKSLETSRCIANVIGDLPAFRFPSWQHGFDALEVLGMGHNDLVKTLV